MSHERRIELSRPSGGLQGLQRGLSDYGDPRFGRTDMRLRGELGRDLGSPRHAADLRRLADQRLPGRVRDLDDHEVRGQIAHQLTTGLLEARVERPLPRPPLDYNQPLPGEPNDDVSTPEPLVETAWLTLRLRTPDGEPIAGERYVVAPSVGDERRGELDSDGHAHLDGLPRGPCRVCFPDIDRGDWRLVPTGDDDDVTENLSLCIVDGLSGRAVAGVAVTVLSSTAGRQVETTDANGWIRVVGETLGDVEVELGDPDQLRNELHRAAADGVVAATHGATEHRLQLTKDAQLKVALGSAGRFRLVIERPTIACVRLSGLFFDLNKSFPLPSAFEGIRGLAHMYDAHAAAEVLVVGHTDSSGGERRNESLSLERAQDVVAFLLDDVEAWYSRYDRTSDASRRWGNIEDAHMLGALPFGETPHLDSSHADSSFVAAVKRFQTANGLKVDGDPGPNTRRALIAAYMAADGTSLPADVVIVAHGCGENFPDVPSADGEYQAENRRVEMFIFDEGILPTPPSPTSKSGSTEYAAWRGAVDEERTFIPSADGLGVLVIVTDIRVEDAATDTTAFRLYSTDGAYDQTLVAAEAYTESEGMMDIQFENLPRGSFYTLTTHRGDEPERTLFADVPYVALSGETDRLDEVERFDPDA